jgi:hypothetical protein
MAWWGGWAAVAPREVYPRAPMPERVALLLLEANRAAILTNAAPRRGFGSAPVIRSSQATNEAALKIFSKILWPDFAQFKRVRCRWTVARAGDTNLFHPRWLFYNEGNQLILLTDGLAKEWRIKSDSQMEDSDYAAELAELIKPSVAAAPGVPRRAVAARDTMSLVNHAVAAAWLGHTNQARQLWQLAVNTDYASETLWRDVGGLARADFHEGLNPLRTGAPRSEVLKVWDETLRIYGPMLASTQLVEYVTVLRQQVEEFPKLAASTVENPGALAPAQRAAYFADRLQDAKEGPNSESLVEPIVALGREAIPALIAHLRDRRLTRLTGTASSSGNPYNASFGSVVRVQDLAMGALERVSKVRFLEGRSRPGNVAPLSARPPAEREQIASTAETWWRENGDKSPVAWRMARLNALPLAERVAELAELEQLHPRATNYLALLQSWTNGLRGYDWRDLVRPLARHGDLSLVWHLREEWKRGVFTDVESLLRYGNAQDYGLLRDANHRRQLERPDENFSLYAFRWGSLVGSNERGAPPPTNALLVPLLVDTLSYRAPSQTTYVNGRWINTSPADAALRALIALTGHNEGYDLAADPAARNAALDRWEEWWKRTGQQEWLAAHPETRAAFGSALQAGPAQPDLKLLNEMARILPATRGSPLVYEAPREQISALLGRGAIEVKQFAGVTQIRFTSPASETAWFAGAKAQAFTNASYTAQINQVRLPVRRPGRTANAYLYPSMRLESADWALPDTRGRTWAAWRNPGCATVACFEDAQWRLVITNELEPYGSDRHEFSFALPLGDRAMILAEGFGEKTRLHLLQDGEDLEFSGLEALVQREASSLRQLLPFPPAAQENGLGRSRPLCLAKDREGNIWWSGLEKFGVLSGKDNITFRPEKAEPGQSRFQVGWLNPLPKGAGVIASGGDTARIFTLESNSPKPGKSIQPGASVTLPDTFFTGTGAFWPRFLRESDGRFWVSSHESLLLDANLRRTASQAGSLLLRDSTEAMWFVDYNHTFDIGLVRRTQDGRTAQLRLRGISGSPCDHGDGSVWAHTTEGVVRVALREGKLEVVEEAAIPYVNHTRLWHDAGGRLWVAEYQSSFYDGGHCKLTAYSTRH